jgi:hypothetical protein
MALTGLNGAKIKPVWDVFRPALGVRVSTSVIVLVLVIDSLDCLATGDPTDASFGCLPCFTFS